jgi:uncharacterized protein
MATRPFVNPFRFGALARDEAFTDRDDEIRELSADGRNGQDVVIFAPRRYGKTSLIDRVAQKLVTGRDKILVGQINLMKTPTKERLAAKLAVVVYEDFASIKGKLAERARIFAGLRVTPQISVDPEDGSVGFSFGVGHAAEAIDATLERLFELIAVQAADRRRRAVLVLDEFQEIVSIDEGLLKLMRSVFQEQPDVAHIYLGSKRHMMERIFNDENEPYWRSAKHLELGPIPTDAFASFIVDRFAATGRSVAPEVVERILATTHGHPYATQQLCYFVWEETPVDEEADAARCTTALANVLRSEHTHFSSIWDRAATAQRALLQALAHEPGHPLTEAYRARHQLPAVPTLQSAIKALERAELVGRERGRVWISEPFLAEWIETDAE